MVMTRSTAIGSIVTGSILLVCGIIVVICGAVSASKLSGKAAASAGLWSLYLAVPGILSIVAGGTKNGVVMGFALFFNIIAVILSTVASIVLILFVVLLNEIFGGDGVSKNCKPDLISPDHCKCHYNNDNDNVIWNMNCDDLDTLRAVVIAMMIFYFIITVTSFISSIFGCLGTCCAPVDPVVVVTAGVPAVQSGSTVVVASNQSTVHGYPAAPPPSYGYPQPPAYGDKSGLVQNMAI